MNLCHLTFQVKKFHMREMAIFPPEQSIAQNHGTYTNVKIAVTNLLRQKRRQSRKNE